MGKHGKLGPEVVCIRHCCVCLLIRVLLAMLARWHGKENYCNKLVDKNYSMALVGVSEQDISLKSTCARSLTTACIAARMTQTANGSTPAVRRQRP